jgi:hypothetical protein
MEKKNLKQQDITRDFIRSVGCNVFLIPAMLIILSILVVSGFTFFRLYFFQNQISLESFHDPQYLIDLIGLTFVILAIVTLVRALWRNTLLLHSIVTRYRSMRQEKTRIDRLIKSEVAENSQNAALLQYAEDESYKELANGKR